MKDEDFGPAGVQQCHGIDNSKCSKMTKNDFLDVEAHLEIKDDHLVLLLFPHVPMV